MDESRKRKVEITKTVAKRERIIPLFKKSKLHKA